MEHNREEKREGREIRFGGSPKPRKEKEHGKIYRWFDNFWYHHKWKTIASTFLAVVVTVCTLQMCGREKPGDIIILTAGPYGFFDNEAGLNDLKKCLSTYIPEDYNGNGVKDITLQNYTIFSEDEAKEYEGRVDENGDPLGLKVDRNQNTKEYQNFSQYIINGNAAILFLSPWLANQYATTTGLLMNFTELLGTDPQNGMFATPEGGKTICYGIKLCETALWRENSAIRANLPEDTVICLMKPTILGKNADVEIYNRSVAVVKALIQ